MAARAKPSMPGLATSSSSRPSSAPAMRVAISATSGARAATADASMDSSRRPHVAEQEPVGVGSLLEEGEQGGEHLLHPLGRENGALAA